MKKVLIFGAGGLVGNALQNEFLNDKNYKPFFSYRSDTNLLNFSETKYTVDKIKPDIIINSAAKVGGIYANDNNRVSFLLENLKINMNILESILDKNSLTLINLGSSCIYPLNAENPIKENSLLSGKLEPTNSPYALAKISAIELGNNISKEYGHNIINLMPTNLYGPFDNFDHINSHVIPGLISRMSEAISNKNKIFKIWGDGTPLREFMFSQDLANCVKFILKNDISEDILNIGSNEEISILNLANKIKDLLGYEGKLIFDETKPNGNPRKLLDSSKIYNYGWKPKFSLDEGLKITLNWYRTRA